MAKKSKRRTSRDRKRERAIAHAQSVASVVEQPAGTAAPRGARRLSESEQDVITSRAAHANTATGTATLDADDFHIPLSEVPYATRDLRRVLIIASLMVMIIIIADIVVSAKVK